MKMWFFSLTAVLSSVTLAAEVVKVSDFGYDPADSTEFIRQALASGAKKVILDRQAGPWYTLPLKMPSNIELELEGGVELVAKRGAFLGKRDYLMELSCVTNVILRGGEGSAFRMWKCDYQKPPYEHSEWRYALRISRSKNVLVENLRFLQSGGDGIGVSGEDITIRKCVCDGNHRQGMSVFSARNLLVEDTILSNTKGTPPQAGLDIEPDVARENLRNVVFRNCQSFGNAGNGFEMYLVQLNKKSGPIDITFENCRSWNNRNDATVSCGNRKGGANVEGKVRFVNCAFGPSRNGCVSLSSVASDSVTVDFVNTVLTNSLNGSAAVRMRASEPNRTKPSGVDFGKLTVYGDGDWFKCGATGSGDALEFGGEVTVVASSGRRRVEKIDDDWARRNVPSFDGGRPVPQPAKLPEAAAVEAVDNCPGELVDTQPFTVIGKTSLVFFADKPQVCRFVMRQVNMVKSRPYGKQPMMVVPVGGGAKKRLAAPGATPTEIVYKAKRRGFYRLTFPKWGTRLRIERTSVPIAVDASDDATVAPLKGKSFALVFAGNGEPFTFIARGSDYYRFKIAMFDAEGKMREHEDVVSGLFIAHGEKGDATGICKVQFERAEKPQYDHISIRQFGGSGFFFLTESKMWMRR